MVQRPFFFRDPRMAASTTLADRLIARFQKIDTGPPSWAWPFKPAIPLVGRRYKPGRSLLVYASAENLNSPTKEGLREYFQEPVAWNRYRVRYDADDRGSKDAFFPHVGIRPVTDGGLLAAALLVSDKLGLPTAAKPRTFLERIAVSNWCKFSIRSNTNHDYIANLNKLIESLPFVIGELAELRPAVVLLPKKLWEKPVLRAAMRGASPWTRFLPIWQFNTTVVNTRLGEYRHQAERMRRKKAGTALAEWMANLHGFNKRNAWRFIAMLETAIRDSHS